MGRLTRDGIAEPVSRDQILRLESEQRNIHFPCSAEHVQDWQPYPVDTYSCYMCDHTYIQYATVPGNVYFSRQMFLKKNQSTPRPSEHPPVMGEKMSKRLGGIKGCKYKISSWHLNRFPDADTIGSTV